MQQKSWHHWIWLGMFLFGAASTGDAQERLNNFVTEYLNLETPAEKEFAIEFQQPGWLFVRTFGGDPGTSVTLDSPGDRLIDYGQDTPSIQESMRFVATGPHQVKIEAGQVERLQVRRIAEIRYCRFHYDPWVYQEGPFDWAFLEKHILPHVNTIVGTVDEDQSKFAEPWRATGKRWVIESLAPGIQQLRGEQGTVLTADEIYRELSEDSQLDRPWVDGLLVDEYLGSMKRLLRPPWPLWGACTPIPSNRQNESISTSLEMPGKLVSLCPIQSMPGRRSHSKPTIPNNRLRPKHGPTWKRNCRRRWRGSANSGPILPST